MLQSLHIENIAVIKRLDLDLREGFSVLSGETGAGKSIILDSINLLLGNRVSRELIRTGENRATVSAVFSELDAATVAAVEGMGFSCEEGELMISRTIGTDGRGGARVNGQAVPIAMQRELGRLLINIHGQNDNQRLLQKSSHAALLDAYAHDESELDSYRAAYRDFCACREALRECDRDAASAAQLKDVLEFQIKEIGAAHLKVGEEEKLTRERDKLQNIEKIAKQVKFTHYALQGSEKSASVLLERAAASLRQITGVVPECEALAERLISCRYEIEDIAEMVREIGGDGLNEDPTELLNRIESRLDTITKLERKYGADIAAVLAHRDRAKEKLEALTDADGHREKLQAALAAAEKSLKVAAAALTAARRRAREGMTAQIGEVLRFLDMPRVHFDVRIAPVEGKEPYRPDGGDDVEFLISTNPGEPLLPMIRIASGGELSRIMLAIKSVLSGADGVPTVIFDEVDTGVSGKTSRKIGIKLKQTACGAQVLCVTHSAQIVSLADHHYYIYKEENAGRTETRLRELTGDERIEEIARILGGMQVTDAQRESARELMKENWE